MKFDMASLSQTSTKCNLKNLKPGIMPETLTIAKESHALQLIMILVDYKEEIESIVNPGSQIIPMSEDRRCIERGVECVKKVENQRVSKKKKSQQGLANYVKGSRTPHPLPSPFLIRK
jgi:glycerol-3-phosphate responsive antiterminator